MPDVILVCTLTFAMFSVVPERLTECPPTITANFQATLNEAWKTNGDTIKVNQWIATGKQMRQKGEYSEAMRFAEDALAYSQTIHYARGIAEAQSLKGTLLYHQRNYTDAVDALLSSQKISEEQGYPDLIATDNSYIGAIYGAQGNAEVALEYCGSALTSFEKHMDNEGQVLAHYHIGFIYRNQGDFTEALHHFNASLGIAQEINLTWAIAANENAIGTVFGNRGEYTEALSRFIASKKGYEQLGNKVGIADAYHHIGIVHFYQGDYSDALTYYLAALKIRQETGDAFKMAESYHDIGHIYFQQGQYNEALVNYTNALKIFKAADNKQRTGLAYNSLGNVYTNIGDIPKALENYEASIAIQEEIGDKPTLLYSYNNIGRMYVAENELGPARKNLLAAQQLGIELGEKEGLSLTYQLLGILSYKEDSLAKAKGYLEQSIALGQRTGNKNLLMHNYEYLARVDSAMGNDHDALANYKLHKMYTDSILSAASEKIIADLKIGYETERKDHEIERLKSTREIDSLQSIFQQELLGRLQSEKNRIHTENLFHLQQIELLDHEKKMQQLQLENSLAAITAQNAEADRKQDQLALLNKEAEIQAIKLKRQTTFKNYMIAGFALFGLLSFFVYHYFITRQKLKLQTLRNKIATDLHDDVGSTLSSIAIFSEIAQQQSKEVIPLLQTITDNSRQMLDAMADIVWTIHPENDQLEKIILRMRSYAYELLGAKQIGFDFTADDAIAHLKLPMDVRKNLFLIFKEATNNIVKYSEADTALFAIRSEGDHHLSMEIRDNGKGFDINGPTEGNGLKNIKKRAREVGGKLMIDSLPGKGTIILLKIAV